MNVYYVVDLSKPKLAVGDRLLQGQVERDLDDLHVDQGLREWIVDVGTQPAKVVPSVT